eukprot:TRINITY_DN112291_c0_g1_i1.p1 TRINITY_DN112291_c0_g1~~TRINITY_DN112291_c0_g1_i1.p1  ORF type:complete len:391 (-),score=98.57 TRINITY_DN112291_c0_g1_i1:76-1137(-)
MPHRICGLSRKRWCLRLAMLQRGSSPAKRRALCADDDFFLDPWAEDDWLMWKLRLVGGLRRCPRSPSAKKTRRSGAAASVAKRTKTKKELGVRKASSTESTAEKNALAASPSGRGRKRGMRGALFLGGFGAGELSKKTRLRLRALLDGGDDSSSEDLLEGYRLSMQALGGGSLSSSPLGGALMLPVGGSNSVLPCGLRQREAFDLMHRELRPEDYELLSKLDESVPNRGTADVSVVDQLVSSTASQAAKQPGSEGVASGARQQGGAAAPADGSSTSSCGVCLVDFEPTCEVVPLPACQHVFHRACISKWLTECKNACPLCATPVAPPAAASDDDAVAKKLAAAASVLPVAAVP